MSIKRSFWKSPRPKPLRKNLKHPWELLRASIKEFAKWLSCKWRSRECSYLANLPAASVPVRPSTLSSKGEITCFARVSLPQPGFITSRTNGMKIKWITSSNRSQLSKPNPIKLSKRLEPSLSIATSMFLSQWIRQISSLSSARKLLSISRVIMINFTRPRTSRILFWRQESMRCLLRSKASNVKLCRRQKMRCSRKELNQSRSPSDQLLLELRDTTLISLRWGLLRLMVASLI